MLGDVEELERDLACGLEMVAKALEERYLEFQPLLEVAEEDIIVKLEELSAKVDDKLRSANNFIRENSENDASSEMSRLTLTTHERHLRKKLLELSDLRQLLDKVHVIEGLLISCRSTKLYEVDEARNLIECVTLLNEITKDEGWVILTGRVRDILREEVNFMIESLKFSMICAFDEFISFPATEVKDTVHMRICNENSARVGTVLASLEMLNELDSRLKRWVGFVIKNFVQPIVDSGDGVDPYGRFVVSNGTSEFIGSSKIKPVRGFSLEGISSSLACLFTRLADSIKNIEVHNRPLSLYIGGFLQEEIMTIFLKRLVVEGTCIVGFRAVQSKSYM
ncbi:hypothetical protein DICVIV_04732 [Dictyocaulus viviparus]|uniref:Centromere/kinetochore protein zw10 middle domain-containing protein n=1 Tax=Dictyocaulus viviparus TaxID=29172 RepID=A0A0D8XZ14_DICVI|nr:hypothetical protein DICVIV_04732 [Dictyocaulus viviparus]